MFGSTCPHGNTLEAHVKEGGADLFSFRFYFVCLSVAFVCVFVAFVFVFVAFVCLLDLYTCSCLMHSFKAALPYI